MDILKRIDLRKKQRFNLAEGVTARERFSFTKSTFWSERKSITIDEAKQRLDDGEEVVFHRDYVIKREPSEILSRTLENAFGGKSLEIHNWEDLENGAGRFLEAPFPKGLYDLKSGTLLPQQAYELVAGTDIDSDLRFGDRELKGTNGEKVREVWRGFEFMTDKLEANLPENQVVEKATLDTLNQLQAEKFLTGEFEDATELADGAIFLQQHKLLQAPDIALALLTKTIDKNLKDSEGPQQTLASLIKETSRRELFQSESPIVANSAKAYHALVTAIQASQGGIFSPAAPLTAEVQKRLHPIRSQAKTNPTLLARIADIDEMFAQADGGEEITDFFHRVKYDRKSRKALGHLSEILAEDHHPVQTPSKLSDGTALEAHGLELTEQLSQVAKRMDQVSNPELRKKLASAKADLEKRIAEIGRLGQDLSVHREEEIVLSMVSQILDDKSIEEFVQRADAGRAEKLIDSRTTLSVSQLERIPLVGSVEVSENTVADGYLSKEELISRLNTMQLESLEAGMPKNAARYEAASNELSELTFEHNGQLYSELERQFEKESPGTAIDAEENEDLSLKAQGLKATYMAVRQATQRSPEVEHRNLSFDEFRGQTDRLLAENPNDLKLRATVGMAKLLFARAGKNANVSQAVAAARNLERPHELDALAEVLSVGSGENLLEAKLGLNIPENFGSVRFHRVRLEQLSDFLAEKADTASSSRIADKIELAQEALHQRSVALDDLSARLVEAAEEASVNALLEDVLDDSKTQRLLTETEAQMISVVSEAEAKAEIAEVAS